MAGRRFPVHCTERAASRRDCFKRRPTHHAEKRSAHGAGPWALPIPWQASANPAEACPEHQASVAVARPVRRDLIGGVARALGVSHGLIARAAVAVLVGTRK